MVSMFVISELKNSKQTFVIAEIGQNHQGDILTAKKLTQVAKECGADCVKFQKTCLEEKFTTSALNAPYLGPNSWGKTYGDHKAYLEFSHEEFLNLQQYARDINILFTASAMDEKSLEFLENIKVPFIKIGSGDSNNFLLIERAAQSGIPLVISTGMIDFSTIQDIYNLVSKHHKNFAILHCVSAYPTPYEDINLRVLHELKQTFSDIVIGYSGHELGIHVSVSAVAMGAKIIERHITLDKNQKGSDHRCSLDPEEFKMMVQQIRTLEKALGTGVKIIQESEKSCYEKLGKSLVYSKHFERGHIIQMESMKVKVSRSKGFDATKYQIILGKKLNREVNKDDPIQLEDLDD